MSSNPTAPSSRLGFGSTQTEKHFEAQIETNNLESFESKLDFFKSLRNALGNIFRSEIRAQVQFQTGSNRFETKIDHFAIFPYLYSYTVL